MEKEIRIALAGNPNCGKTTLFNALTGSNQYVGNWPGVTVEKKEGRLRKHDNVIIQDLPGPPTRWKRSSPERTLSPSARTSFSTSSTARTSSVTSTSPRS